jgi:hypothetical protein
MTSRLIGCLIALMAFVFSVAQVRAQDPMAHTPVAKSSTKCRLSDTGCIKKAKAQRKKVEIVEEREPDMLRCSSRDAGCLRRAMATGGKVDISD